MDERRKSSRTRALKGARIVYGNGSLTRDCAVRNLGKWGKAGYAKHCGDPGSF
jgi:hypothetical protein